ncbi:MAG: hypothetical protein FJ040_06460 [Chloroflexi bacterium]|nr:hypothetical protein [Chloroflexota bacterium]
MHYVSFAVYITVALHAIWAGSDTERLYWLYVVTAMSMLFLVILRLITWVFDRRAQPADAPPETA